MNDLSLILKNQRDYKNLKYNIKNVIKCLDSTIESLEIPSNKISSYYNIDEIGIDNGQLNTVRQELIKKRNYLKNIVLIELNNGLEELEDSIEGM